MVNGSGIRPRAVLVVDDELAVRLIVARMLEDAGYTVQMAPTAAAALLMLTRSPESVQLVLADVRMPGMTGLDFAVEVGRSWPDLPLGLMSGHEPEELQTTHTALASLPFLQKPFTTVGLLRFIAELANRPVRTSGPILAVRA